ncbi:MAG TPA: hypothetical protein VN730_14810 [Steroidobacteraceae bacterium]|nr:hypothetical protein [Steroidobacteraceae bacterium]
MADSEYQKRTDGNQWVVFDVTPAPVPKFMYLAVMGAIACVFGLLVGPIGWFTLLPVGVFGIWFGYVRDMRPPPHRTPSTFRVSPTSIEANGRSFGKDDIHRLIIKNGISNEVIPNIAIVNPSTSSVLGAAYKMKVSRVTNSLELETGGRAHVLAGGMDQTTAFGLLHDVSKVLGLSVA